MKQTLLEMTQDILSALDSDEVNSIGDTVEATQVARVIRDCYNEIISRIDADEFRTFFELTASGDSTRPTLMSLPPNVDSLEWLRYNKATIDNPSPNFTDLQYISVPDFLDRTYNFNTRDSNVGSYQIFIGADTFDINYQNDVFPKYYTMFDDATLIFDTYDASVETTLTKNRTMAYGIILPTFVLSDSYVPDLDANLFSLLRQEAKAQAFAEIKQSDNATARGKARRQWVHAQIDKDTEKSDPYREFKNVPNYGRRATGRYSVFSTPKSQRGN